MAQGRQCRMNGIAERTREDIISSCYSRDTTSSGRGLEALFCENLQALASRQAFLS